MLSFQDILDARDRIRDGVLVTPCNESEALSRMLGCHLYCKSEYLQRTGSFKERGARNAMLRLTQDQRARGVIAASAGNHALALAYHGRSLSIPVTVVMPVFAPLIKQSRCRDLGAIVLLSGSNIAEAKVLADRHVTESGLIYIHGFDGEDVMAGAGTLGLEILDQVPDVDAIIVPVGGGGLIAGLSLAVKTLKPDVEIIGVETENAASYSAALACGHPVPAEIRSTLADGLAVPEVGPHAFEIARSRVSHVVLVDEESVALAILRLLEIEKGVVEGAGAACLAAMLQNAIPELNSKRVVLCLCGGNIDPMVLGRVIEHALALDGRLAKFRALISDRPGGLAKFCEVVAGLGAGIKQIVHERAFAGADVASVELECTVETRGHEHVYSLLEGVRNAGFKCTAASGAWQA
jgi:threonine dehydratase